MNILLPFFNLTAPWCSNPMVVIPIYSMSSIILMAVIVQLSSKIKLSQHIAPSKYHLFLFFIPIIAILSENIDSIYNQLFPGTTFARILGCIAWMTATFKFHSFLLFIEKLTIKNHKIAWYHYLFFALEAILCFTLIGAYSYRIIYATRWIYISRLYSAIYIFWIVSAMPSLITISKELTDTNLPYLIKKQIRTFLFYFLLPCLYSITVEFFSYLFFAPEHVAILYRVNIVYITLTIYFCFKQVMQFRFLNLANHVQAKQLITHEPNLKDVIERINIAGTPQELNFTVQQFVSNQLAVSIADVQLYIRPQGNQKPQDELQQDIEMFFNKTEPEFQAALEKLYKNKILVKHELEFDEFYTNHYSVICFAQFLRSIHADIVIPIVYNKQLLGYITVNNQENNKLYNLDQQNKLIVFAQFLAPALHVMNQQNIYALLQENKISKETLHEKNQEINQYKESIKQLLKDRIENHIGIMFYKNRHFSFKNQEAQTLLEINPNLMPEHPTTASLINFAQQIEKYQTTQTMHLTMHHGSKLVLTGMPHAQTPSSVLFIIRKPEATDLIKMHIDAISDNSNRDYLLYLQSTGIGQTINKLLPSNHESFIQTKIKLLNCILQKSALFLHACSEDLEHITTIIREFNTQKSVDIIDLQEDNQGHLRLFGINPLLSTTNTLPLLTSSDQGTIILKNIEALDTIAQQKLVQLLRYGIFTQYNSEQRLFSQARIICTSNYPLIDLIREKKIVNELHDALESRTLSIPSLITMDSQLLMTIIDEYMFQILQEQGPQQVQALNIKEKEKLLENRVAGLLELKQKITNLMLLKAQDKLVVSTKPTPQHRFIESTSAELQLAAQLGKDALKDVQLMKNLWKKLGNQAKIADLLGVNRSSVSRRCKDYNLS